ncbi:hypothetical protein MSAN_00452900 [Mycena sanguinolenta]|uniref:F-box domain-containing protein n=1 Tax=Mycena sanguinolenta TaxID=230812 RepID=A0A8H6ZB20_9AGAR|nr:hypothetical protein MSAN_00452900 [Mycena sanguinolenta]
MSSPFATRLGTNYCPTDLEVLEIQSFLAEPTRRLKSLDAEIADLQKSIDKLIEERDGLKTYVDAHQALISPVRRLPRDIVQEIFLVCLPTHRNCVMSATEAPILLGRICSAWRAISLSLPSLWASLHVVEPQPSNLWDVYEPKVAQRVQITKTWLGRSGQCALSISLECSLEDVRRPTATMELIQALIPFAPRWKRVHFSAPPSLIFGLMSYVDIDMPWLESVVFHCGSLPQFESITSGSLQMLHGAAGSSKMPQKPKSSFAVPGRLPPLKTLPPAMEPANNTDHRWT